MPVSARFSMFLQIFNVHTPMLHHIPKVLRPEAKSHLLAQEKTFRENVGQK